MYKLLKLVLILKVTLISSWWEAQVFNNLLKNLLNSETNTLLIICQKSYAVRSCPHLTVLHWKSYKIDWLYSSIRIPIANAAYSFTLTNRKISFLYIGPDYFRMTFLCVRKDYFRITFLYIGSDYFRITFLCVGPDYFRILFFV